MKFSGADQITHLTKTAGWLLASFSVDYSYSWILFHSFIFFPFHHYVWLLFLLLTFTSAPSTHSNNSTFFSTCLFYSFSCTFPSWCVLVCMGVRLCWGWLWGMWKQQGSSLVTHQLWNLSVSGRRRDGKTHRKQQRGKTMRGRKEKDWNGKRDVTFCRKTNSSKKKRAREGERRKWSDAFWLGQAASAAYILSWGLISIYSSLVCSMTYRQASSKNPSCIDEATACIAQSRLTTVRMEK